MMTAKFTGIDFCVVYGLYQWDSGQMLKIEGLDLADGSEVHFANSTRQTAIRKKVTNNMVEIPDELLEQSYDITAWVYVDNETFKEIFLPIEKRKKPDGFVTDQEAKTELEGCKVELEECKTELAEALQNQAIKCESIKNNDDGTISAFDVNGNENTVVYGYNDKSIRAIKTKGGEAALVYNGNTLVKIGETNVELCLSQADRLYKHYGIDKAEFPYVAICKKQSGYLSLYFFQTYSQYYISDTNSSHKTLFDEIEIKSATETFPSDTDFVGVVDFAIQNISNLRNYSSGTNYSRVGVTTNSIFWSNIAQWQPNGSILYTLDFGLTEMQNGFALGMAIGGGLIVPEPFVWEKELTFAFNDDLQCYLAECDDVNIPDGAYSLFIANEPQGIITTQYDDGIPGHVWLNSDGEPFALHYTLDGKGYVGMFIELEGTFTVKLTTETL